MTFIDNIKFDSIIAVCCKLNQNVCVRFLEFYLNCVVVIRDTV